MARLPLLDKVVYRWGIDPSVQFLQMQHGDVDILGEGLAASVAARVQGKQELREAYTKPIPVLGISYAEMNTTSPKLEGPAGPAGAQLRHRPGPARPATPGACRSRGAPYSRRTSRSFRGSRRRTASTSTARGR